MERQAFTIGDRAVLDACVLYPTILREVLLDVASAGLFVPVWSPRILAEWRHAAARLGPDGDAVAGAEIAQAQLRFPGAEVVADEAVALAFDLPDPADRHVVAAAMAARAGVIVTANLRDFPRRALAPAGLQALHPDDFLMLSWLHAPETVAGAIHAAHARARAFGGTMDLRALMKRARLPRLARALRD